MLLVFAGLVIVGFVVLVSLNATTIARLLRGFALLAIALLALFVTLRGLAVLDVPLGGLVVFLLHRWSAQGFPGMSRAKAFVAGRRAGAATIETSWLRMSLDQATGALGGEVLAGEFAGARLDQLSLAQLRALAASCAAADPPSLRLVETYLDRTHPDWRDLPGSAGAAAGEVPMTRAEALRILGLAADADAAQVREAHRRLMMKLHPDHGGSDYLAGKINAARDVLTKC